MQQRNYFNFVGVTSSLHKHFESRYSTFMSHFARFICFVLITFCPHRSKYVESKSSNPKYSENFELIASAFIWSAILLNVHFPFESCPINQYAGPPTNQVFKDSEWSFYKATNSIPYSYIKFMTNFKDNFLCSRKCTWNWLYVTKTRNDERKVEH